MHTLALLSSMLHSTAALRAARWAPVRRCAAALMSGDAPAAPQGSLAALLQASVDRHAQRRQGLLGKPPASTRLLRLAEATPADWRTIIDALAPRTRSNKLWRLEAALRRRRAGLHVVVENLADPHNAAAVTRAAEGLGVQHLHCIESVNGFAPAIEAFGNDYNEDAWRWLTIHRYASAAECAAALRARGLRLYASDCPTAEGADGADGDGSAAAAAGEGAGFITAKRTSGVRAAPLCELDLRAAGGTALAFGSERRGVSRELLEAADGAFYLPMVGFTQSFNIGVALAMSLAEAVASGAFPEGTLSEDARAELLGRWLLRDCKEARAVLLQAGLEFSDF